MLTPTMNRVISPSFLVLLAVSATAGVTLQSGFQNPPAEARPHTWWHWCNGNISKEGITLDLEAMRRIGVGGAQIFNVAPGAPAGPVLTGSPEWRELTKFAVTEADRVGVELAIHNCPGWSESGGPWVTPEQSMQKVVWEERRLVGPQRFAEKLPQPETVRDFYRDIAVLAFPTVPADEPAAGAQPVVTASVQVAKGTDLTTPGTPLLVLPLDGEATQFVQLAFPKPCEASSLIITAQAGRTPMSGKVEASDDGMKFRKLASLLPLGESRQTEVNFPKTKARFFRITLSPAKKHSGKVSISRVEFAGPRLSDLGNRAGFHPKAGLEFSKESLPAEACVVPERIVDLTSKLGPDGTLTWDTPAGSWTILRIGHTSTGQTNAPAPDSGRGLECDKMSRAAVEAHFDGMMAKVIADAGPLAGKTLKMVLADSWEAGCQNWTPMFRDEFKKRRGYDLLPWLVTISGRPVGDVERSERFLWDFRRTIADLIAENHYGVFQELCHKHGMLLTAEAPGIGMPTIADQLQCKAFTDVPMGEFWLDGHNDSREPACAAHIFGKKLITAEAFTAGTNEAKWSKAPFDHKALGDLNFCRGINRFVFHRYAMQPWKDRFPGMTMGPWGTNFERTNTWWEQAGPWMRYISRCQFLLQSGLFSADVLYFYGEEAPVTITGREPQLPQGFDFDACDTGALFKRVSVKDGRLVMPDGMSYRFLLLPPTDRMSPAVVRRVKDLAEAGAVVVGVRPAKSPSLRGWPECDQEVRKLADELWGAGVTAKSGSRPVGKGRVIWGKPIEEVCAELNLKPDFEADCEAREVARIHRSIDGAEVYFVSNQEPFAKRMTCTFRVSGKVPELWRPETGTTEQVAVFSEKNGRTVVPLQFEPAGAVFVVFRKPASPAEAVTAATLNGKDMLGASDFATDLEPCAIMIEKAVYGANPEKGEGCADVTAKLKAMVRSGRFEVRVDNKLADDPALNRVKRLSVQYTFEGAHRTAVCEEGKVLRLIDGGLTAYSCPLPTAELTRSEGGALTVNVSQPGEIEVKTADGKMLHAQITEVPKPVRIEGGWTLSFPPKWGAPEKVSLDKLVSWSQHGDEGVKHFSGTAIYLKEFNWETKPVAGARYLLDLGAVKEIAQVKLNGQKLGTLWKPPFRVDATAALRPGKNVLEVRVTNLWPNRMIGDAALPKEKRFTWSVFEPFKPGDPLLTSGLLGPVVVNALVAAEVK